MKETIHRESNPKISFCEVESHDTNTGIRSVLDFRGDEFIKQMKQAFNISDREILHKLVITPTGIAAHIQTIHSQD